MRFLSKISIWHLMTCITQSDVLLITSIFPIKFLIFSFSQKYRDSMATIQNYSYSRCCSCSLSRFLFIIYSMCASVLKTSVWCWYDVFRLQLILIFFSSHFALWRGHVLNCKRMQIYRHKGDTNLHSESLQSRVIASANKKSIGNLHFQFNV